MTELRRIDPSTEALQAEATDPERSAWVSANAGSGKTHVLTQRVVRLLLAGADPSRLLCLTFTKAAAAEMANRVFKRLGLWASADDAELDAELVALEGTPPTGAKRARARRLFALALETPGGLKLQTVHAFCERILHQFPFEAGVSGHFQVLEENAANALVAEARRETLGQAMAVLDSPLGEALRTVVLTASDRGYEDAVAEIIEDRAPFERWVRAAGSLDSALVQLSDALGVGNAPSRDQVEAKILAEMPFSPDELQRLLEVLQKGSANDQKAAHRLAPFFAANDDPGRLAAYRDLFCRANGGVRKPNSLITNKVREQWEELDRIVTLECRRLEDLIEAAALAECYTLTAAVLRLVEAVLAAYRRKKAVRGLLDFDDLINRTLDLLSRSGASAWVHYKVDQGIDHILLDEAQDTSPGQWRVIQALAEEFFAGEGIDRGVRTLFAVGDEKQSIYSFQGAVPAWFSRVKRQIAGRAAGAGLAFSDLELKVSFRSTPDIVKAIDAVFKPALAHTGLSSEPKETVHEAIRRGEAGEVVIWPMEPVPEAPEQGEWAEAFDHLGDAAPEMILAARIARTVRDWLDPAAPTTLDATGRPIRPGEILILTRKRGPLTDAINRSLKAAGVPVAGADRLWLSDHIAVRDLIALGDVVLQDRDDLSLAAVLKSPLFGLSEEALYAIAFDRGPRSLWLALKDAADAEPFAEAYRTLERLRATADSVGPFAFYAEVLGPRGGRRQFESRLGAEADDIIEEFLAQALAFERLQTPTLQGFLEWIRSTAAEIRRETDSTQNAVRVMTVHGAKGLEADVVFLVDDGSAPASPVHDSNFVALTDDPDAAEPVPLAWARGSRNRPELIKTIVDGHRERDKQEYRRLLYVGATRARDRLIVCGTHKDGSTDRTGGWHALVSAALMPGAEATEAADGSPAYVWRSPEERRPPATASGIRAEAEPPAAPAWLRRAVSPARQARAITPSRIAAPKGEGVARAQSPMERRGLEMRRGQLLHRLLEALPELPEADRLEAADRFLAAVAGEFSEAEQRQLVEETLGVLNDPAFASVFGSGSRGEVGLAAELESSDGPVRMSGRIDRLAITDHEVMIVDYKTDRPAPESPAAVRPSYIAQLAIYVRAIRPLYPNRSIRAALLWTAVPMLMPIPGDSLVEAAERVLRPGDIYGNDTQSPQTPAA